MEQLRERIANLRERQGKRERKLVVNAGLLKAGKSSLFNALAGKELFETDVVRATIENQRVETEHYVLLDTPGLDACESDDKEALKGYIDADVIIFVHNLLEGELNQIEVDAIRFISGQFNDDNIFFKNVVLVLTCKDQKEDEFEQIQEQINEQCQDCFNHSFEKIFCVDSVGYIKGLAENKTLLVQQSGIEELKNAIIQFMSDDYDLQKTRIEKERKEIIADLDRMVEGLRRQLPDEKEGRVNFEEVRGRIREIADKVSESVRKREVQRPVTDDKYKRICMAKDFREYSSESSARSAGKSAIESAIQKIAGVVRSDAKNAVELLESYVTPSKVPSSIRDEMAAAYEEMRKAASTQGIALKRNFDIRIDVSDNTASAIKGAYMRVRYLDKDCFQSASHYATSYSTNLDIDYDYRTEYVSGLFGGREKEYKVYEYDIQGALDDISYDGKELIDDIIGELDSSISSEFSKIKESLLKQFSSMTTDIYKELDEREAAQNHADEERKGKTEEIQKQIDELSEMKESL